MPPPPVPITHLIIAIIQGDDQRAVLDGLNRRGFSATVVSSTGGFLRQGNATVLVGTNEASVNTVLTIIRENARTRTHVVNALPSIIEPAAFFSPQPVEVEVGGAVCFVVKVDRFERF
ncbi:MAG: cyclic-di-AMP receptor [Anaerolineae bacterium]